MIKIFRYLKPYKWSIILLMFLTIVQVVANLTLPDFMARIVDEGIVGQNNEVIYRYGFFMIGLTLLAGLFTIGATYLSSHIGTSFAKNLRERLFSKIENFSLAEFNKFSTASLITRNTNDVQQVQMVLIMFFRIVLMAPLIAVIASIKAFKLAPSMTWILVLGIILLLSFIFIIFKIAIKKFVKLQELIDKLNLVSREILSGLRVIRAFSKEKEEKKKFAQVNKDLTGLNLYLSRLMALLHPSLLLLLNLVMLSVVVLGARKIDLGQLQVGSMMAFMQYAMQAIFAFQMISFIFIMFMRASVSAKRIMEVLETEPSIKDPENPQKILASDAEIEFKNVNFSYADQNSSEENVLQNISFIARSGETTAIIGSTGSGKSTLINLIPRFYDVSSGQVSLNGVDVRQITQKDLRSRIAYVSQKAILFSGSIKENLSYGKDNLNSSELNQALEIAQASDFVNSLTEQENAPVSPAGLNFSGGQKQRLAIARALARPADIYIFDDSFSALDFKTDLALRRALNNNVKNKTIIIVAQRINTIMNADKIIVLDDGRIVGQGSHQYLLKNCSVYQEIAWSQFSPKELAERERINQKNLTKNN